MPKAKHIASSAVSKTVSIGISLTSESRKQSFAKSDIHIPNLCRQHYHSRNANTRKLLQQLQIKLFHPWEREHPNGHYSEDLIRLILSFEMLLKINEN